MNNITIIAIDPGASGAGAVSHPNFPHRIHCYPTCTNSEGDLLDLIIETKNGVDAVGGRLMIYIEHVTGYIGGPNKGSHMFTFGRCYEYVFGICHALKVPLIKVQPAVWQARLNMPDFGGSSNEKYKARKKWLLAEARTRLPEAHRIIADTCDAALICDYVRTLHS